MLNLVPKFGKVTFLIRGVLTVAILFKVASFLKKKKKKFSVLYEKPAPSTITAYNVQVTGFLRIF